MTDFSLIERAPQPTAVIRATIPVSEIPSFLGRAYSAVMQALAAQHLTPVGAPFVYYLAAPTTTVDLEAGFPIATPCEPSGEVEPGELPGGTVATATHFGPYERLTETYDRLMAWVVERGLVLQAGMWEIYLTDPQQEPDSSKWQTEIFWPVSDAPGSEAHPRQHDAEHAASPR